MPSSVTATPPLLSCRSSSCASTWRCEQNVWGICCGFCFSFCINFNGGLGLWVARVWNFDSFSFSMTFFWFNGYEYGGLWFLVFYFAAASVLLSIFCFFCYLNFKHCSMDMVVSDFKFYMEEPSINQFEGCVCVRFCFGLFVCD